MTGRVVTFLLVLSGCAAAVPVAMHAHGGPDGGCPLGLHGGPRHAGAPKALRGPETMQADIDGALDALGLAPGTRAQAGEIVHEHFARVLALRERFESGEIGRDAMAAEHQEIFDSAHDALAPLLTREQFHQLVESLHPQCAAAAARK